MNRNQALIKYIGPWNDRGSWLSLSDGVALVLYNMMNVFAEMQHRGLPISTVDITLGVVSFFTVALGGLLIGIVMGVLTALITKTTTHVRGQCGWLTPSLLPSRPLFIGAAE